MRKIIILLSIVFSIMMSSSVLAYEVVPLSNGISIKSAIDAVIRKDTSTSDFTLFEIYGVRTSINSDNKYTDFKFIVIGDNFTGKSNLMNNYIKYSNIFFF